jgi:hypothetical protein
VNVFELTGKGVQELHEVLGLGVLLLECVVLICVVFQVVTIWLLIVHLHYIDDLLHLGHIQLLVERVKGSTSLSPVLCFTLGGL